MPCHATRYRQVRSMRAHVYILQGHLDSLCLMFRMVEHLCSRMTGAAQPLISKQLLAQVAQLMTLFGSWRAATRYADWPVLLLLLPACLSAGGCCMWVQQEIGQAGVCGPVPAAHRVCTRWDAARVCPAYPTAIARLLKLAVSWWSRTFAPVSSTINPARHWAQT